MSRVIRSFSQMLGLLSRGDFARKLDEDLTGLIQTLEDVPGDSAKATMTVTVEFIYELGRIDIKPTFKVKLPDTNKFMKTPFWAIEGALSVEHPSQADMFAARVVRASPDDGDTASA